MSNNRLDIEDTETGEKFMLAKGWGDGWTIWDEPTLEERMEKLEEWLNGRDFAAACMGDATRLRLATEHIGESTQGETWQSEVLRLLNSEKDCDREIVKIFRRVHGMVNRIECLHCGAIRDGGMACEKCGSWSSRTKVVIEDGEEGVRG